MDLLKYINDNKNKVQAIIVSVNFINPRDISVKETLAASVEWEYKYYLSTNNLNYLYTGLLIIEAYMQLRFPYEFGKEHFDKVLTALNADQQHLFPRNRYYTLIKLNKARINSIFGRWYHSPGSLKKAEMVDEIINNVTNKKKGICTYQNNHGHTIELVITDTECYLHDIQYARYYTFIKDDSKTHVGGELVQSYYIY